MGEAVMESKLRLSSTFRRQYNLYGDPALNLWPTGYTVSEDLEMSGVNTISEDLTVSSGVTLAIDAGSTLKFANGASLIVNGTLDAQGTANNPIIFTSVSGSYPGSWGSIIFDGSSASNSVIQYDSIKYGGGIQCLNGANVTIENSYIKSCVQGIYIYNSSPQITGNHIMEPQQNGIYGDASGFGISVEDNTIYKTSSSGSYYHNYQGILSVNNTVLYITNNNIRGFYWGMYLGGGVFASFANNLYVLNNVMTDNNIGLGSAWGSTVLAGLNTGAGGYNSIHNNRCQKGLFYCILV